MAEKNTALVMAPAGKHADHLTALMSQAGFDAVGIAGTEAQLQKALAESIPAVILLEAASERICAIAKRLLSQTPCGVVVIRREEALAPIPGALTLMPPFGKELFFHTLEAARVMHERLMLLHEAQDDLRQQLDETRLVSRAKCVLIQYLGLGEEQAHHYIERQAMDRRVARVEVARDILKTYDY